jgi:CheY-like chemotaxis protein
MKWVLIVDDEESLLLTMQAGFEAFKDRFGVITARNGVEASKILSSSVVDLVVTDLKMPEMDGFELLAYLRNHHPAIPAIVMTAFATPAIESRLSQTGMIRMLEKPVDFEELSELILSLVQQDFSGGTLVGISLPSFLQLIEMEQNTCLMEVKAPDGIQGLLYFNKGVLYDAVLGAEKGAEAVYGMLAIDDVKINFRSLPSKKLKRRIETPLLNLLIEGARRKDELGFNQTPEEAIEGEEPLSISPTDPPKKLDPPA